MSDEHQTYFIPRPPSAGLPGSFGSLSNGVNSVSAAIDFRTLNKFEPRIEQIESYIGKFNELSARIQSLRARPAPSALPIKEKSGTPNAKALQEELFDAVAGAKILTSQVAMHLDSKWRKRIFEQLDSLHDLDAWESGDRPLQRESFSTFLKVIFLLRPKVRPGLGLSIAGHLVGAWTTGGNHLTIEFLPRDRVQWVVSITENGETERTASEMPISRLRSRLMPYTSEGWIE